MIEPQWYSPHAVTRFTKEQVRWLIPMLPMLRSGEYPPKPGDSGYINQPGSNQPAYRAGAKWETPAGIAAELDLRIQRAGVAGLMMEFLYAFEPADELFVIEHMAQCLNLETKEVAQRIRNALYYVSGQNRKSVSYSQYVRASHQYLRQR